jgi:sialate O-acetylesterase
MIMRRFGLSVLLLLLSAGLWGQLRLPGTMSDGMVLQRNTEAHIYGFGTPGKTVRVRTSWDKQTYSVRPGQDSLWCVSVRTGEAGGPYSVSVRQGSERLTIGDVLLGEVWLCSGQSNMQMPLMGYPSQPVEGSLDALVGAGAYPNVRLLQVPRMLREGPQEDVDARWQRAGMASAAPFSAIGWWFATRLSEVLDVPVGMIEADWGATRIQPWMRRESARAIHSQYVAPNAQNLPQALFDCMVWPLRHYTLKGFLWYQGEGNKEHPEVYADLMAAMVSEWRAAFGGDEKMPFYYVMLAPFQYDNGYDNARNDHPGDLAAPLMWEAQQKALALIPGSDMAVTTDLGAERFIHPCRKRDIADRLLLLALHGTYGEDAAGLDWRGPLYRGVTFQDGYAEVEFETVGTLMPSDPREDRPLLRGFEIAGEDRVFHKASAWVERDGPYRFTNRVIVQSPQVPHPVAVRYAFHNLPDGNLTNTLSLPAFPFRTDRWDDVR